MMHEIAINDRGENAAAYELGISKQLAPKPTLGLTTWISIGGVLWLAQVAEPQDGWRMTKSTLGNRQTRAVYARTDG